ncbi:polymer-forming cytoskeletal protein [Paenibacillus sp. GSMTC-2017]|uniref:polymer-forming cytoskeletal protein n=1 Tax=Paenibacillus sp. GSMTC-2017 TaxID=2794350 RepID=UPI0018D87ABB|nr:polymer-forming cytoskeletal protein [Paenibacillus sp. GSMTC-2017]MBH5318656.1 polymer-forming cytoskeletal protein [Paenibacillus sp. GSMTC-2017]
MKADGSMSVSMGDTIANSGNLESELPELKINGISDALGGDYSNVWLDGVGRLSGDVRVTEKVRANGVLHIDGSLNAQQLSCDGKLKIAGSLKAGDVRLEGMGKIGESVAAESFTLNGVLTVHGDFETEKLIVQGAIVVDGLLNADEIELGLVDMGSRVQEVGGESILVKRLSSGKLSWVWNWAIKLEEARLKTNVIEGDNVNLEFTDADIVRGKRVIIGKGCKIRVIEYRDELNIHPSASVMKEVRIVD